MVAGVFGPYSDTKEASDAMEVLRGVELPRGLELHIVQRSLEDPVTLIERVQELSAGPGRLSKDPPSGGLA